MVFFLNTFCNAFVQFICGLFCFDLRILTVLRLSKVFVLKRFKEVGRWIGGSLASYDFGIIHENPYSKLTVKTIIIKTKRQGLGWRYSRSCNSIESGFDWRNSMVNFQISYIKVLRCFYFPVIVFSSHAVRQNFCHSHGRIKTISKYHILKIFYILFEAHLRVQAFALEKIFFPYFFIQTGNW